MTLMQLAAAAGMSYATLVRMENGSPADPSPFALRSLSEVLQVGYMSLMEAAGYIVDGDENTDAVAALSLINEQEIAEWNVTTADELRTRAKVSTESIPSYRSQDIRFAIRLCSDRYLPVFASETTVVIAMNVAYSAKDYVIELTKNGIEIGQVVAVNGQLLVAPVPNFKNQFKSLDYRQIVGRVVEWRG
jgi:transcriptional regulator with XRE-family HTH domain